MPNIFISHASRDKQTILNIINPLPKRIGRWIDQERIVAGDSISGKIENGIRNCDLFLLFVSPEAVRSEWIKTEVEIALKKEREQLFNMQFLVPVKMPDVKDEEYSTLFLDTEEEREQLSEDRKYIKLNGYEDSDIANCTNKLRDTIEQWTSEFFENYKRYKNLENETRKDITSNIDKLWIRISNRAEADLWDDLEDIAVQSVIDGGISAMSYYKESKKSVRILRDGKNPSYSADLQATISIIRTLDSAIGKYVRELGCELYYLGEETVYKDEILVSMKKDIEGEILNKNDFFRKKSNCIKVIIDAIDGTSNFIRGIPFFCSSIAVFIEDQLRISAIYDPLHHHVYSGLLAGPYAKPEKTAKASVWDITSGSNEKLIDKLEKTFTDPSRKKSLGVHIPRNDINKRDEFITPRDSGKTLIKELADHADSIYALNSGLLALAQVACGALDGFVNIVTNAWDVAAGEVILKACGGNLTDFEGNNLRYSNGDKLSVVAANNKRFHSSLIALIKKIDVVESVES